MDNTEATFESMFAEAFDEKRLEELNQTTEEVIDFVERLALNHGLTQAQIETIQWRVVQAVDAQTGPEIAPRKRPQLSLETLKHYKKLYKDHIVKGNTIGSRQDLVDLQEAIKWFTDGEMKQLEREVELEVKVFAHKTVKQAIRTIPAVSRDAANTDKEMK